MKNIDKKEILEFLSDTSQLLSKAAVAVGSNNIAASYAENVEFWQWVQRNFEGMDLSSSEAIAAEFLEKEGFQTQIAGKLYEWDWVNAERGQLSNLLSRFELPDDPSALGIDVTERTLFGGTDEYQLKSYTSGIPKIADTTPHSATVITNSENVIGVQKQGYNAEAFMNEESINDSRQELEELVQDGDATPKYELGDIAETVGKGALLGTAIGLGTEALISYREYKSGDITSREYLSRVLKSGAERGITAGATTGIMIPINVMLTSAGITSLITIPVAFLVHHAIAAPISAAFGKGEYKSILQEAKIYDNTSAMMSDFGILAYETTTSFKRFVANSEQSDKDFVVARKNFNDSISAIEKMLGGKF